MTFHVQPFAVEGAIRKPERTDQAFVADGFTENLWREDRSQSRHEWGSLVDRVLDDPNVRVLIACEPLSRQTITGWLVYSPIPAARVVHFVYVRKPVRRRGIASTLLREAGLADARPLIYTMHGPSSKQLREHFPAAIHMPIEDFLT